MHKTTSLLQALKVPKVSVQIDVNNINLLNTIMKHNSAARDFYCIFYIILQTVKIF